MDTSLRRLWIVDPFNAWGAGPSVSWACLGNRFFRTVPIIQRDVQMRRILMDTSHLPRIHYTELGDADPNSQLYVEWSCYKREVGRLLAEGNEGRFVLIKDG